MNTSELAKRIKKGELFEIDNQRFYHGGRGGMSKGQFVLPPSVTKARSTASVGNYLCDTTQVYVTTEFAGAALYAAGVGGDVYEVQPIGELSDDPDCNTPGVSYSCAKARILRRHRLTRRERDMLIAAIFEG